MKDNQFGILWKSRDRKTIEGKRRPTMAFETSHPRLGPKGDALSNTMSHVSLLGSVEINIQRIILLGSKLIGNMLARSRIETNAGRVSEKGAVTEDSLIDLDPIVDDANLAWLVVEEAINVRDDEQVKIEKKTLPAKPSSEIILKEGELEPYGRIEMRRKVKGAREGMRFNTRQQSRRIVGEAKKPKGPLKMPLDTTIETIYIVRSIAGAPLERENIHEFGRFHHLVAAFSSRGLLDRAAR